MGKLFVILLLCAFVAICFAEEAKKEENPLEDLQASFKARLDEVQAFLQKNVNQEKIAEIANKFAENTKKFITDTKTDIDAINAKST